MHRLYSKRLQRGGYNLKSRTRRPKNRDLIPGRVEKVFLFLTASRPAMVRNWFCVQ